MQPFCAPCQMKAMCSKTGLQRHARSVRHQENSKSTKSSKPILALWRSLDDKIIELRVCAFIAENALALSLSESIVTVLHSLFPTNTSLKSVRLGKQKATNIVRQVFVFCYLKEAVTSLRENKFGIIIDEATDKSSVKPLAILATYLHTESFETKNFLVDMVECANCIYKALKKTFQEHHIPMGEHHWLFLTYYQCDVWRAAFCFSVVEVCIPSYFYNQMLMSSNPLGILLCCIEATQ